MSPPPPLQRSLRMDVQGGRQERQLRPDVYPRARRVPGGHARVEDIQAAGLGAKELLKARNPLKA